MNMLRRTYCEMITKMRNNMYPTESPFSSMPDISLSTSSRNMPVTTRRCIVSSMVPKTFSRTSSLAYVLSRMLKTKTRPVSMAQTMADSFNPDKRPLMNIFTSCEALLRRRILRSLNKRHMRKTFNSVSVPWGTGPGTKTFATGTKTTSIRDPSTHAVSMMFHAFRTNSHVELQAPNRMTSSTKKKPLQQSSMAMDLISLL
mmetsp:Transcript_93310/g.260688  ORF Transcript_93310/g.260688 Transcript_93310/m.260688 type:complete len:201 (-) Transcript_93310:396-998(-)